MGQKVVPSTSLFQQAECVRLHICVKQLVNVRVGGPLLRTGADSDDPLIAFDGRQSPVAAELQRGACRYLRALGHSVVTELALANGRRADIVTLSPAGDICIVEIKSCLVDFQTDSKWHDYLPHCDRLYFAVAPDFPREVIPDHLGLILADRYGGELVHDPVEERLSAGRRKAMMLCFARAAALRLQMHLDPACGFV